jgi:nicotinate-nucleotide adenylyltransferase
MLKDYILQPFVRRKLSLGRYLHSLRTSVLAGELALRFHEDVDEARLAGLAHDLARELPAEQLLKLARTDLFEILPEDEEYPLLLHGRAAAVVLKNEFGEDRESVLQAIRWHTVGDADMGKIGIILFIADYIEPGRKHFAESFREEVLRRRSLYDMFMMVLHHQVEYNKKIGRRLSIRTERLLRTIREEGHVLVQI